MDQHSSATTASHAAGIAIEAGMLHSLYCCSSREPSQGWLGMLTMLGLGWHATRLMTYLSVPRPFKSAPHPNSTVSYCLHQELTKTSCCNYLSLRSQKKTSSESAEGCITAGFEPRVNSPEANRPKICSCCFILMQDMCMYVCVSFRTCVDEAAATAETRSLPPTRATPCTTPKHLSQHK
jgi:hypothetical protein